MAMFRSSSGKFISEQMNSVLYLVAHNCDNAALPCLLTIRTCVASQRGRCRRAARSKQCAPFARLIRQQGRGIPVPILVM